MGESVMYPLIGRRCNGNGTNETNETREGAYENLGDPKPWHRGTIRKGWVRYPSVGVDATATRPNKTKEQGGNLGDPKPRHRGTIRKGEGWVRYLSVGADATATRPNETNETREGAYENLGDPKPRHRGTKG
jgi:hypothetical protein